MERVQRVDGFGVLEEDPATGLEYHVRNNNRGIPTVIPAVRFWPMEDARYRLDENYVPNYNNYRIVDGEVEITPIQRILVDADLGWTELKEKTRNLVHDAVIPAAGYHFDFAEMMPDLQIKLINNNPKLMGLKHQERNKGVFDGTNFQIMYNTAAKAINFGTDNFVFPSADPTFALIGCKQDTFLTIWEKGATKKQNAKGQDLIEKMKALGMIKSTEIDKITMNYKIVSKWTHVVEIIIEFNDSCDYMN